MTLRENSHKKMTLASHQPQNLTKQDFVLHGPFLFCKRAGERRSSQCGVLVLLLHALLVGAWVYKAGLLTGNKCVDLKEAALLLIDRLQDVS